MTDEPAVNEQETEKPAVKVEGNPDEIDHPAVSGYFSIDIDPKDAVSIGFSIVPKSEEFGFSSITIAFIRDRGGVVQNSIGATNFSFAPFAPGQKVAGGTSEQIDAFPTLPPDEKYRAILQGTLRKEGKEENEGQKGQSFYLSKTVDFNEPQHVAH